MAECFENSNQYGTKIELKAVADNNTYVYCIYGNTYTGWANKNGTLCYQLFI